MNPARTTAFLEAYALGLCAAIKARPKRYRLRSDDTPETYALRVTLHTAELIEQYGMQFLMTEADGFRRACTLLGIAHSEEAIRAYLEGAKCTPPPKI